MFERLRRVFLRSVPAGSAPVAVADPPAPPPPPYGSWTADARWNAQRRSRPITYAGADAVVLAKLREEMPRHTADLIAAADRTMRHEFNLLGSGWFVPSDPARRQKDGYQPIDWYLDPVRALRFPGGVPHTQWNLYEMRPGNADVKYPWELARCQHWVTLAQAHRLTGERNYADEIARQLDDFVEANPVGIGINWTCTMDVGLRAVNWVLALDLVRDSALDDAFWSRASRALFDHGLFIRANLENNYEVTSNHFLSNVLGLWFLAAMFDDLTEAQSWAAFARDALETEINVQVLPDGADFESSVPYHRLVTELFLGASRLADVRGQPLSGHYRSRVRDMVAYLAGVMRPDGLMPQSGDADDGRLHVFGGLGTATPQVGRHLLGPASVIFGESEWRVAGGAEAAWESAWWGLGFTAAAEPRLANITKLFPDAGHVVIRNDDRYLLITNSIVGTRGFGNHKHNDQLSFEYHAGIPWIVDPGSYVYTSSPDARNLFRSTAYHNTLMIDGIEQNEFKPEWLFRMFEHAKGEHVSFDAGATVAEYRGRHIGYTRLPEPVTHERHFKFDTGTGRLRIEDRLSGSGAHDLRWHFHFAPGVDPTIERDACILRGSGVAMRLEWSGELDARLDDAWYSPSYGVRVPCRSLNLSSHSAIGADSRWSFTFVPKAAS
jgi:hypothetical protein